MYWIISRLSTQWVLGCDIRDNRPDLDALEHPCELTRLVPTSQHADHHLGSVTKSQTQSIPFFYKHSELNGSSFDETRASKRNFC